MNDLSTPALFQLLSQCPNLTHLVVYNDLEGKYKGDSVSSYPVLNSLKSIRFLSCVSGGEVDDYNYDNNDISVALKILQMAPNLEYLEFKYRYRPLLGTFLESLAKTCPKLKGIHLQKGLEEFGNGIQDEDLFKFLQHEPRLEYIYFDGCFRITGSIYSKMGQFKQLKYFNVERKCYIQGVDIVPQCDEEPFTGDGVLPHLQYLNIGPEMKGVNVDRMLKMAPNVKDVGQTFFKSNSNYLDLVEKLANRLPVIPSIGIDNMTKFTQKWLEATMVLERLAFNNQQVASIDFSTLKPIPSVKKIEVDLHVFRRFSSDTLKELFRVFPCVEVFLTNYAIIFAEVKKTFIELIKEGKWPNLQHVTKTLLEGVIELRPHITWEVDDSRRFEVVESDESFEKKWLQWDYNFVKLRRTNMERFFTNDL